MEERLERLEKNMNDLIEIVVSIKENVEKIEAHMATKTELAETKEELGAKIDGIQRGLDANFERTSALEARVSKIETHLHM